MDTSYLDTHQGQREVPMRAVEIRNIADGAIEEYYGKGIMIDFANKRLGGGVLKNGCVQ